ncbi:unnamed protein product [Protopolystoma xenopodis]|uniref:Uncharacterized protein n=1 Tax=Protopolystoma xenopodis TaxID=117903 RepID=A0A448XSL6_9PLAT|nr:unnamed protein product [Protopolystoma xenopodis]
MNLSSDDVHQMMDKSLAPFHPKRGRMSRGMRQPERRIKANGLQYNGIHPFQERKPLDLESHQKFTEAEFRLTLSHRTPPPGSISSASALTNPEFMKNLFSGGLQR